MVDNNQSNEPDTKEKETVVKEEGSNTGAIVAVVIIGLILILFFVFGGFGGNGSGGGTEGETDINVEAPEGGGAPSGGDTN